jgi:hypothetical protein
MTTKTLTSLIIAGVLATSAAAAVQVIQPASVSAPASSVGAEPASLLVLGLGATPVNKQRPAGVNPDYAITRSRRTPP